MPNRDQSDEAARRLRLGRTQERILAARLLGQRGTPVDIAALKKARNRELDHHVRHAIDQALRRADDDARSGSPQIEEDEDQALSQDTYSLAFRSVAKMLVHELRDVVGFARLDIAREVPDLDGSKALRSIERIAELLDAIEELAEIEARTESVQFDLSDLVLKVADREGARLNSMTEMIGPGGIQATGIPGLVDIALAKGIENAAESTAIGPKPNSSIVINWGVTDRDAWFAVIDDGAGLTPDVDVFGFGKSSKEGHLGVGLTLAAKSIKAMSGTLTLEPNGGDGATLRATWPLPS
jgi:signal transduction histidine kinase